MKKCTLLFLMTILSTALIFAQEKKLQSRPAKSRSACPPVYLGTSTGINNQSGLLGFNIEVPIVEQFSIGTGVGISSWGTKVYGEGRYYLGHCQRGWAFGAGISHSTGLTSYTPTVKTVYGSKDQVTVDLDAKTNFFLAAYRFWTLGKRQNRFYITFGYSVPLTKTGIHQVAGPQMTTDSYNTLKAISPGGLIAAAGFSFGIH